MLLAEIVRDLLTAGLSDRHRAIRLRLHARDALDADTLLVQQATVDESLCGGTTAQLTCLSARADLPLHRLRGAAIELQMVTDRGGLRSFCLIVTEARAGQSDGGLAIYQLVARDALAVLEGRRNTRVFRQKSVVDISRLLLDEWRQRSSALAACFDYAIHLAARPYPAREFAMQLNESDAAFLRRSWKRAGIAWFIRPGDAETGPRDVPHHELVLFDDAMGLQQNRAGTVRYHRLDGTEARDAINRWVQGVRLSPGSVRRESWDHETHRMVHDDEPTLLDQGRTGSDLAALLCDAQIEMPHAADDPAEHRELTRRRIQRHEFEAAWVRGSGNVRDLAVGEWFRLEDHPGLDGAAMHEREFVLTELHHEARNNLPKELQPRATAPLDDDWPVLHPRAGLDGGTVTPSASTPTPGRSDPAHQRYGNQFAAVQRGVPIVPAWDPRHDLPPTPLLTALVVGPADEEVWCDDLGRVKLQFLGLDPADHAHADGAGTRGDESDSAWVRVDFGWAGPGYGAIHPLRAGMEVDVAFLGGDPDRPVVTGARYNGRNAPPHFSGVGSLPRNRYLSGIRTREVRGGRANQLRFDDTPGQISAQLDSQHGHSQLNLGYLTSPRLDGRGTPRGEGAELRSDAATAVRGAHGVLISSAAQPQAAGPHLERDELLGLVHSLGTIVESMEALSTRHRALGLDPDKFQQLARHLQHWEHGSNTASHAEANAGTPAAIVALDAAQGAGVFSHDNLLLGARSQLDTVSAGHTQLVAGQRLLQRAGLGISLLAQTGPLEGVAAEGPIDLRAHQGSIELTAADSIVLTAGQKVVIQAPEVRIVSEGAQTRWGDDRIVEEARSLYQVKAASFAHASGGDGEPAPVELPEGDQAFDQRVLLTDLHTDAPVANRRYRITVEDGQVWEGMTDETGLTQVFRSTVPYATYSVQLLEDTEDS